jgi:hypothetical protein
MYGYLYDYESAVCLRAATEAELRGSLEAAKRDGGAGVIGAPTEMWIIRDAGQTVVQHGEPPTDDADSYTDERPIITRVLTCYVT